jgi:hypothetical protein
MRWTSQKNSGQNLEPDQAGDWCPQSVVWREIRSIPNVKISRRICLLLLLKMLHATIVKTARGLCGYWKHSRNGSQFQIGTRK